jgi:hypothetical protein
MENLFNKVIWYGYKVRKNKLDGLEHWNKLKNCVKENNIDINIDGNWEITVNNTEGDELDNINDIYDFFHDDLGMRGEEDDEKNEDWEKYHFFLQLARIPKKNKLDLIRLLQVAYNIGQYNCDKEEEKYDENAMMIFNENNLGKLVSYSSHEINENDANTLISFINDIIKEEQYHKKYIKYKNKYLSLKLKK